MDEIGKIFSDRNGDSKIQVSKISKIISFCGIQVTASKTLDTESNVGDSPVVYVGWRLPN